MAYSARFREVRSLLSTKFGEIDNLSLTFGTNFYNCHAFGLPVFYLPAYLKLVNSLSILLS